MAVFEPPNIFLRHTSPQHTKLGQRSLTAIGDDSDLDELHAEGGGAAGGGGAPSGDHGVLAGVTLLVVDTGQADGGHVGAANKK